MDKDLGVAKRGSTYGEHRVDGLVQLLDRFEGTLDQSQASRFGCVESLAWLKGEVRGEESGFSRSVQALEVWTDS